MKTNLKVTLLFAGVALAGSVFASGNLKVNILPVSAEKAEVAISSLTNSNLKITLQDEQANIIYYKEVSDPQSDYKKIYDFSQLEPGQYKITVESEKLTSERYFDIKNGKILVGDEKTTLQPFFAFNNDLLRLSYLNFQNENLTLNFYDQEGLVYSRELGSKFNVSDALNLSKLEQGKYTAVLSAGKREFAYNVEIKD